MKIHGEFATERTTRDQADQGVCLGLFQHGCRARKDDIARAARAGLANCHKAAAAKFES